ncbi:MAG: NAD(P)H-hydrate dehydratase [Clostridia bacterium]|nr:NAD(P)H-hydrate dehydratase [Clostridia bacterium]
MINISTEYVKNVIKPRPAEMHKGQAGKVLIIAGSKGMAGAAVLAARGALYSGAGLVKVAVPDELFNILQISVPEAMCINREKLCKSNPEDLEDKYSDYDAIAIGPGIGINEENYNMLRNLLSSYYGPIVVDADALNCMTRYGFDEIYHKGVTVLTPHPGEADRLLRKAGYGTYKELGREKSAKALAAESNAIFVLKGAGTIVADGHCLNSKDKNPEEALYLNPTGNPGMATGGSGDVLTGIIAAFLAQKNLYSEGSESEPVKAVNSAVFIHGLAGDIAAENIGEYGMTSADIADAISVAIKEMEG